MPVRDLLSAASGIPTGGGTDPYFYDVSLLLNGDGTNGAQNNTFLDSSSNNFTITRNGSPTQGSFSPYGNLWSNYFDGSSALTGPTNNLNINSGNFTIEAWVYLSAYQNGGGESFTDQWIVANCGPNSGNWWLRVGTGSNNYLQFYNLAGSSAVTATSNFPLGTWVHVAAVKNGGTITLYQNGVSVASGADSTNFSSSFPVTIGTQNGYARYWLGYISNVRVTTTAVYTGNFTPPTTPLSAISGTQLLTCQSNRFIDNSANNFSITVNGSPSVQRFSPFNPTAPYSTATIGGSGYFDGSSYLTMASNSAFSPGTGDFTVECWVNFNPSVTPEVAFFTTTNNISGASGQLWFGYSGGQLRISRHGSGAYIVGYTWSPGINNWHYVTATRASGTTYLFIDGVLVTTSTVQNGISFSESGAMIGVLTGNSPPYMQGYLTDVRYTVGTALYTSTFTSPTAPLTSSGSTTFLASFQNAGIPDLAMQNDLQTVGSAQVSTSVKKYGTGSISLNGSTDWLTTAISQNVYLGSGDFTIEGWFYSTSSGNQAILSRWSSPDSNSSWEIIYYSGTLYFQVAVGSSVYSVTTSTFPTNQWNWFAMVKSGTTMAAFLNGTRLGTTTVSGAVNNGNQGLSIGVRSGGTSFPFSGYLDDIRITNGYARYDVTQSTITPPTAALPTY